MSCNIRGGSRGSVVAHEAKMAIANMATFHLNHLGIRAAQHFERLLLHMVSLTTNSFNLRTEI